MIFLSSDPEPLTGSVFLLFILFLGENTKVKIDLVIPVQIVVFPAALFLDVCSKHCHNASVRFLCHYFISKKLINYC